jgi:hypothetical protein
VLAAAQHSGPAAGLDGSAGLGPQMSEGGEVVGPGDVAGVERAAQPFEIAGGAARERSPVAGELGEQERPQTPALPARLVHCLG